MHTLIPTHSDAMCHTFQVRWPRLVGARSALTSAETGSRPSSSTIAGCLVTLAACLRGGSCSLTCPLDPAREGTAREHGREPAAVGGGRVDVRRRVDVPRRCHFGRGTEHLVGRALAHTELHR